MYFVSKVEMQNHFVKIHMKITNFICKCTTRQNCLLVPYASWVCHFCLSFCRLSLRLNFWHIVHLMMCIIWYLLDICNYNFWRGFHVSTDQVICAEYFSTTYTWILSSHSSNKADIMRIGHSPMRRPQWRIGFFLGHFVYMIKQ